MQNSSPGVKCNYKCTSFMTRSTCLTFQILVLFRFAEFVSTGKHFNEEEVRSYEFVDEDSSYSLFTELEESEPEEEHPSYSFLNNKT